MKGYRFIPFRPKQRKNRQIEIQVGNVYIMPNGHRRRVLDFNKAEGWVLYERLYLGRPGEKKRIGYQGFIKGVIKGIENRGERT